MDVAHTHEISSWSVCDRQAWYTRKAFVTVLRQIGHASCRFNSSRPHCMHVQRWWQGCSTQSRDLSMHTTHSFSWPTSASFGRSLGESGNSMLLPKSGIGTWSHSLPNPFFSFTCRIYAAHKRSLELRIVQDDTNLPALRASRCSSLKTIGSLPDRKNATRPICSRNSRTEIHWIMSNSR